MFSEMAHNIASDLQKDEYKVIIIGALGVGKTSLLLRYVHNTFEDRISKFISEEKKSVVVNGREIVLHLWDTAGKFWQLFLIKKNCSVHSISKFIVKIITFTRFYATLRYSLVSVNFVQLFLYSVK